MKNQFSIIKYFKNLGKQIDDRIDESFKRIADNPVKLPPRVSIETLSRPLDKKNGSCESLLKEELSREEILKLCKKVPEWRGFYGTYWPHIDLLSDSDEYVMAPDKIRGSVNRFIGHVGGLVVKIEKERYLFMTNYDIGIFKNGVKIGYAFGDIDNLIKSCYLEIKEGYRKRIEEKQKMKITEEEKKRQEGLIYARSLVGA